MSTNSIFDVESWICPICHDPLLNPVVAEDGLLYNKECFVRYCKTQQGKKIVSPMTKQIMGRSYTKVIQVRSYILDLITGTNMFDEWLHDLTIYQIDEYNLSDYLIHNTKLNFLNK